MDPSKLSVGTSGTSPWKREVGGAGVGFAAGVGAAEEVMGAGGGGMAEVVRPADDFFFEAAAGDWRRRARLARGWSSSVDDAALTASV